MENSKKRIGIYAWGGPGTVRLLETKYHRPQIKSASFLGLYDRSNLKRLKELFAVSDAWVTFSWGFSDETEKADRQFIVERLKNFAELGIATHAYIQGFNLVSAEFAEQDLFCHDVTSHLLPYSKGRSLTCPNNPAAVNLILARVQTACQEKFTGIFIDNLIFGLPPVSSSPEFTPFFGCACKCCQKAFFKQFGYHLPLQGLTKNTLHDFLEFRTDTIAEVIRQAHQITEKYHKELGVNLFDPYLHTSEVYFGYALEKISPYLSYYLIENHTHPARMKIGNSHLLPLIQQAKKEQKPVFVVSYKNGIGFEAQFSQADINLVASEAAQLGYAPCYKMTEFTTRGIWHTLNLENLQKPHTRLVTLPQAELNSPLLSRSSRSNFFTRKIFNIEQRYLARILTFIFENRFLDQLARSSGLYQRQLWSVKK